MNQSTSLSYELEESSPSPSPTLTQDFKKLPTASEKDIGYRIERYGCPPNFYNMPSKRDQLSSAISCSVHSGTTINSTNIGPDRGGFSVFRIVVKLVAADLCICMCL